MLSRITIVLADWCPHCVPLSVENGNRLSRGLNVPLRVLNIDDPKQVRMADKLVRDYGDDVEDYLIPQVFLEDDDGTVRHIFTGFSEAVKVTEERWSDLFSSRFYREELHGK
jgi:hypothetical protein